MIKKLAGAVREYRKWAIMTPFLVACEVILEVLIPYLMAKLIDNGIEVGDQGYIIKMGLILAVLCLLSLAAGAGSGWTASKASTGFAANLRHDMYHNVQKYSFSNIDRFSTSSIVTRLTTDVARVQMTFQMITRIAVRSPLMLIFSLVMAYRVNARLSLVFLAAVPVLLIGLIVIFVNTYPVFEKVFKAYDDMNRVVGENLHGIRVVKSFVREEHETDKFNDASNAIFKYFKKASCIIAFNSPLMQTCMYGVMLGLAWFGAKIVVSERGIEGGFTTGLLMTMISYTMQILISLMIFSAIFMMIVASRSSAKRICEILDEKSDIVSPENAITEVPDGSVKFENVCFGYSSDSARQCLKNINLDIKSGETIGIIGGTGSSKSSLIQLIPRLYDVTEGRVLVGGHDVREYDLTVLRDSVSVVLQKNELFSGTIAENLRWGKPDATQEELEEACRRACAHEFIESFPDGYETFLEQGGKNVSGGQKQRLCIARALLKNPKILILDDSTSAVDTHTDALIREAFANELPDVTKFIIAQRIASVEDADRIIVIDNGVIDGFGTNEELLENNKIYKEVYTSQVKGGGYND